MRPLGARRAAELAAAPYSYAEVGATTGALPPGYRHVHAERTVAVPFETAVERLVTWQVAERAGLRVAASAARAAPGVVCQLRWLGMPIPCRVVYVVSEPDRAGFAYGTLPGHPEQGEEAFVLERAGSGTRFTITAFSRPATLPARLGAPVARRVQDLMTQRYLGSLA